jgi:hypothetical protein
MNSKFTLKILLICAIALPVVTFSQEHALHADIEIGGGAIQFTGFAPMGRVYIELLDTPFGFIGLDSEFWFLSSSVQMILPALVFTYPHALDFYAGVSPVISLSQAGVKFSSNLYALKVGARKSFDLLGLFAEAHLMAAPPLSLAGAPNFSFGAHLRFGGAPKGDVAIQSPPEKISPSAPIPQEPITPDVEEPEAPESQEKTSDQSEDTENAPEVEMTEDSSQQELPGLSEIPLLDHIFIGGGFARLSTLSITTVSVGIDLDEKVSAMAQIGIGGQGTLNRDGSAIAAIANSASGLLLYELKENFKLGIGGGMLFLSGQFEGGSSFTSQTPYLSAVIGYQWNIILFTLGVNYVP